MKRVMTCTAIGALSLVATAVFAAGAGGGAMHQSHATMGTTMSGASVTKQSTMGHSTTKQSTPSGPSRTGQPNQSCGSATAPNTPGNAASARGSAFNPDGQAGTVYAGEQPQNSGNTASVSQYDVACAKQPGK